MLLVLLGLVEGLNCALHLLTGGACLLLPPGMVEFVEAVQGLPPSFLLHQLNQPTLFQLVAVPDLHQRCTELADGAARGAFEGIQQLECLLQVSLTKQSNRLIHQGLAPAFEGLAMKDKVAMARGDQLLLQR